MMKTLNSPFFAPLTLLGTLIVYLFTVCPTVYLGDSGELTAAAFCLGIPHNSGYPLYALLGKLFCLIPLGNIGFRMNLMSTSFALATIWLVYSIIVKWTRSGLAGFVGAWFLAFSPLFWFQTVSAEVYTLHAFFVALLLRVLLWWDKEKGFYRLVVLVFLTGLSFGNHLQTVMLAPGVLWVVLCGDRRALLNGKRFLVLSVFFVVALSVYLYLPIRTEAGAAIHWGDPNSWDRFIAHVSGRSHREVYVLSKGLWEYTIRGKEALLVIMTQFWGAVIISAYGWFKCTAKWRVFWILIVAWDLIYTIFLNTISLQITAFMLPTAIVVAILAGVGLARGLEKVKDLWAHRPAGKKIVEISCCLIPLFVLVFHFDLSNQSKNYTGYEWATNILRTPDEYSTLFLEGDNNLFPVLYLRVAERSREDLHLYDRQNIVFKIPYLGEASGVFSGGWSEYRALLEKEIIQRRERAGVFYAVFETNAIDLPGEYKFVPHGLIHQVVEAKELKNPHRIGNAWTFYGTESFFDKFSRDYLNREVCAHFLLRLGQYFFMTGDRNKGYRHLKRASTIGYDDRGIHGLIAFSFADEGLFEEARNEVERNAVYQTDASAIQNTWGCYYYKLGDYDKAVAAFKQATDLRPNQALYHKNLAFALMEEGKWADATRHFRKSLKLHGDQPDVMERMKELEVKDPSSK
jgi:Tfp pilus assembly protein PilF